MNTSTRIKAIAMGIVAIGFSSTVFAQGGVDLGDEENKMGYAIGVNIGQNLVNQGLVTDVPITAFMAGLTDAIAGEVQLEEAEIMNALQAFMALQQQRQQDELNGFLEASEAFLAENGQRDGVVTTDSGLQYEVIESGPAGGESPTTANTVLAHYHGTLIDGSVFDSSVDRGEPISFAVTGVIAGWTEALQLMKVGDKWRLFIHPEMAYGQASPSPAIPPNSALIFEVELLEVN